MRINFILDGIGTSGGVRMVFNFANFLFHRGHQVTVYSRRNKLPENLNELKHWLLIRKLDLFTPFPHCFPIHFVNDLKDSSKITDADRVIATACSTAFIVNGYPQSKGEKFYFVQDFENWANSSKMALQSWLLPLKTIVTCQHLLSLFKTKTGKKPFTLVYYGLEDQFFNHQKKRFFPHKKQAVVTMIYNSTERKGGLDGIAALKTVQKEFPETIFNLFGIDQTIKKYRHWANIHYFPTQNRILDLYRQTDIF